MPTVWIPAALTAGLFQAWRTAIQQRLRETLSVSGAGLVRYLYGAPVALLMAAAWFALRGESVPALGWHFALFAVVGGLAQILATNALIAAFGHRGFVVGTAFSKTEALQAALFSTVLLGDHLPPVVWLGIAAGVSGVMVLGLLGRGEGVRGLFAHLSERGAQLGLLSGALFALTAVLIRVATQDVALSSPVSRALLTLVVVNFAQAVMHGGWLAVRAPQVLVAVMRSWRTAFQVGVLSALGSACWFTGFAAAPVALVRVVGQVEVLFTLGFGHFYLREPLKRGEVLGLLLVSLGVVLALVGAL
ncbi:EamA family transporter [Novosphingobium sp. ZN18A2]|uniref:EamA family transporter n=1 Tax=Novosphingobium sp. ZN18A2 TaxID=3079861 RepID=UPI0030D31523